MPGMDDKMQLIGSAITGQAETERASIIEKANRIREEQLAACKEQLVESMFGNVQQQTRAIRQRTVTDKAQAELNARRELLGHREELTNLVFAAVRARLREYTASQEYRERLLGDLRGLAGKWNHEGCTVYLCEADLPLAPEIASILPGAKVEPDAGIKIGGFRLLCPAAGILADETLDSRLGEQKPWFLMNCGLRVG